MLEAQMKKDKLDETKANKYIGKTILIGVSYLDHNENLIDQRQWHGVIEAFSNDKGIVTKLDNSDKTFCLPPDQTSIAKAEPGTYKLSSTGERIEDPDYLAVWTCTNPPPDKGNS